MKEGRRAEAQTWAKTTQPRAEGEGRLGKHESGVKGWTGAAEVGVYSDLGQAEVQGWTSAWKSLVETKN